MIIVNFSHPLTAEQRAQIETVAGAAIDRVVDIPTHLDDAVPFAGQIPALVTAAGLTAEEWQTHPLLINPPAFAPVTAAVLAYLHGLIGHFPASLRLRPRAGAATPTFEVAEIMNLNDVRLHARELR